MTMGCITEFLAIFDFAFMVCAAEACLRPRQADSNAIVAPVATHPGRSGEYAE